MQNLKCKHRTGRSKKQIEVTSSKDKVTHTYEISIVTEHGDFKESEWEDLVSKQASKLLEVNILELLKRYSLNNLAWIRTEEQAYKYALELYASRIWKNNKWVGYEEFKTSIEDTKEVEQISLF